MTSTETNPPNLSSVAATFNQLRTHSNRRQRVPDELRKQAVSLVGRYPKSHIAKALHINHAMLSRWTKESGGASTLSHDAPAHSGFIPLAVTAAADTASSQHPGDANPVLLTMTHTSGWTLQWHTLPSDEHLHRNRSF